MTDRKDRNRLTTATKIIYVPLCALLWLLSKMPFVILYAIADFIAFMARDIVRYRRHLVDKNLEMAFPEKNVAERQAIARKFYRHLADFFVETVKLGSMSQKQLREHMQFENVNLVDSLLNDGKNIIIYTSHFGNWEWITSMKLWSKAKCEPVHFAHVYRKLKNEWFDSYFHSLRSKYNDSIEMKQAFRQLYEWKKSGQANITGFLSDQKPDITGNTIDVEFMGITTPFIEGTEILARRLSMTVLYFDTRCLARGKYKSRIGMICENAADTSPGYITKKYVENLEQTIRSYPPAYLWSHNRWRLSKNEYK